MPEPLRVVHSYELWLDWSVVPRHEPGEVPVRVERPTRRRVTVPCERCGTPLRGEQSRYCSRRCTQRVYYWRVQLARYFA